MIHYTFLFFLSNLFDCNSTFGTYLPLKGSNIILIHLHVYSYSLGVGLLCLAQRISIVVHAS